MKKFVIAVCTLCMVLGLTACGSKVPANTVFSREDLAGKTVGVQLGTTGDTYVTDELPDSKVEQYSKGADAVQALKTGKIDAVMIDKLTAEAFVAKNKDLRILDEAITDEEYAIALKKGNTELQEKINDALAQLKENGTLEQIEKNYIGEEAGKHPYTSPENVERSNGTLTVATNAFFPPYEYYEGDNVVGYDIDMAQAICDVLGMELKISDIEFDAIITAVQSGMADVGIAGMTKTEDRLENVDFSDPYATSTQVVIVRSK